MRRVQIKTLNIAPAGSEGEVTKEQYQYLPQWKMQMQKQPVADVDLTSAGIRQQCYAIPIAKHVKEIKKCRRDKVVLVHKIKTYEQE
jgi:hypothetical protein